MAMAEIFAGIAGHSWRDGLASHSPLRMKDA
jgi:hypothetical protein